MQNEPRRFLRQAERFRRFVPMSPDLFETQAAAEPQEMHCRAGRCSFWIDWQGNISNCGMYPSVKFLLKGHTFADAWKQVVEMTNRVRYSPVCTNCPNFNLCHPCIAMVYNECGECNGRPEYLCRMNEAAADYYKAYAEQYAGQLQGQTPADMGEFHDCNLEQI